MNTKMTNDEKINLLQTRIDWMNDEIEELKKKILQREELINLDVEMIDKLANE